MPTVQRTERGNILFLILLAVILFAALTVAVTRNERGQVKNITPERVSSFVAQLLQNANLIENSMMRAMTIDSIPDYGFDFSGPYSGMSANGTCTVSSCKIFARGNVPSLQIPLWATDGTQDTFRVIQAQIVNVGTTSQELVMLYRHLDAQVCQAINNALSATDIDLSLQTQGYNWGSTVYYSGTLNALPFSTVVFGNQQTTIAGKKAFCFNNTGDGYVFVYALIVR